MLNTVYKHSIVYYTIQTHEIDHRYRFKEIGRSEFPTFNTLQ